MENTRANNTLQSTVAIVGGGLAGLACAITLHRQGIPFLLLEASDTVGGKLKTHEHNGFLFDEGFQAFNTAYEEAPYFFDLKALDLQPFYIGAKIRYHNQFHTVGDPFRNPSLWFSGIFSKIGTLKDKMRTLQLKLQVLGMTEAQIFQLPEQTTLDFLNTYGFSDAYIQAFFKPFFGGVFLEASLQTSVRKFLYTFRCFSLGKVCLPKHGMQAIAHAMRDQVPQEAIWLNSPVVHLNAFDPHAPALRQLILADGRMVEAAFVVMALPLAQSFRLLGEHFPFRSCETINLYFSLQGKIPKDLKHKALILNGEGEGRIQHLCLISEVSQAYAPEQQALISVTLHPNTMNLPQEGIVSQVKTELEAWFGTSVQNWKLEAYYHIPYALTQSSALYGEEREALLERVHRLQQVWNVLVASDSLDSGSINGALRSGRYAALQLLDILQTHLHNEPHQERPT